MDLALILRQIPEEADAIAFLDSVMLLEREYQKEEARLRLDATLHGMEIR
jgi:hypothetical protein